MRCFEIPDRRYKTIEKYVNANDGYVLNESLMNYKKFLRGSDIKCVISPTNVEEIKTGDRISYLLNNNKWVSGGYVSEIEDLKICYYEFGNFEKREIRVGEIRELWYQSKKDMSKRSKNKMKEVVQSFNNPKRKTNYPVSIKKGDGEEIIYYARDSFDRSRFMESRKYKMALKAGALLKE